MLRFLCGRGWQVLWYLVMYLWAGLFWLVASGLFGLVPGAGPQGGEAMFVFLLFGVVGMTFFSTVNAFLYVGARSVSGPRRFIGVPALAAAVSAFLLSPAVIFAGGAIGDAESQDGKCATTAVYAAVLLVWYGLNLLALQRARAA